MPIPQHLLESNLITNDIIFVLPNGPLKLGPESHAWWNIDVARVFNHTISGKTEEAWNEPPRELESTRSKMMGLLDHLKNQYSIGNDRIVLAGFSQGSMLSMDIALRLKENCGGVVVLSGTLFTKSEWVKLLESDESKQNLKCLITHGKSDPILPYNLSVALVKLLESFKLTVQFVSFNGDHTIHATCMKAFASFLNEAGKSNVK